MTLAPSDSPDWTGIPGAARYLGSIDVQGTGGVIQRSLAFTPASYDGAIQVILTGDPQSTTKDAVIGLNQVDTSRTWGSWELYQAGRYSAQPAILPVARGVGANWTLTLSVFNAAASTLVAYVFAIPTYATVRPVDDGQPLYVTSRTAYREPYASILSAAPNAGILASVTFPATPGMVWIVDHVVCTLSNGAGASTGGGIAQVSSTSLGTDFLGRLSVPAVANTLCPPLVLGPSLGIAGAQGEAVTVGFAALVAGLFETVYAAAYQQPINTGP